jgi:hypothetical protein
LSLTTYRRCDCGSTATLRLLDLAKFSILLIVERSALDHLVLVPVAQKQPLGLVADDSEPGPRVVIVDARKINLRAIHVVNVASRTRAPRLDPRSFDTSMTRPGSPSLRTKIAPVSWLNVMPSSPLLAPPPAKMLRDVGLPLHQARRLRAVIGQLNTVESTAALLLEPLEPGGKALPDLKPEPPPGGKPARWDELAAFWKAVPQASRGAMRDAVNSILDACQAGPTCRSCAEPPRRHAALLLRPGT